MEGNDSAVVPDFDAALAIGLAFVDVFILVSLAIVVASFLAAIGGLIRYATRPDGTTVSVIWLIKLGVFTGIPFGIIGVSSGYLTGLSRVGAISSLVPAGLTLLGAVATYLFGKGGKAAVLAAFAIVNFSVMTMVGTLIGGREREQAARIVNSYEYKRARIIEEGLLAKVRRSWGLPPETPEKAGSKDDDDH
jgi:hypothetical protein